MQTSSTISNKQLRAKIRTVRLDWKMLATAMILLGCFIIGFSVVQYGSAGLAGNDGYYHMKMGYLIRTQGLTPDFPFLPYTILNEASYYDHHLLYHVYLAIFANTDPAIDGGMGLTQGAKLASILLPSLAFLAIWWLLRTQKIPYAALWTLGLFAVSEAFLYRMSMPRAQSAALLLLVLTLHWLLQEKFKWLLPLGFIFVWTYNAFPLLFVLSAVYVIAVFLLERRIIWQAIAYPLVGMLLGLIINPYFPQNIEFILGHLAPKLGESATRVGNEWNPYRTWTLVENSAGALMAFLLGVLALAWQKERINKQTLVILGLTAVFGFMLFRSRRFVEYFPPFALLFLAFASAPILQKWQQTWSNSWRRYLLPASLLLLLMYPTFITVQDGRKLVANSKAADHYAGAALWLNQNTPSGSYIFQTDWDDFTRLFFYHDDAIYTAGLDPTFMELQNPERFEQWRDLTRGKIDQPGQIIRDEYGAAYVFSDLKHENFLDVAADDPLLEEVYRDEYAIIFAIKE